MERLTAAQLDAIVAHELCHVRRRDNLMAAIHKVVEALFWFHPLVWWIGARMVEERERACDEEVLRMGNEPEVYAEGILRVCRLYLGSPITCMSGVTGSDLKKRIEGIMTRGIAPELGLLRKLLLAGLALGVIAAPVAVGVLNAPSIRAQAPSEARLAFEVASIKPTDVRDGDFDIGENGRFKAEGVNLETLITFAYDIHWKYLKFSDPADEDQRYTIEAMADSNDIPPGLPWRVRDARVMRMVQTLLTERFKLKIRRETKEMPVYAIVVGKNGPRLTKAKIGEKDCPADPGEHDVECHAYRQRPGPAARGAAVSVSDIVRFLDHYADRPMVDRTGLKGLYEIDTPRLPWLMMSSLAITKALERPTLDTIFGRLGLKMESSKAPIEVCIMEHIEKPTPN
jgi:uncharacterized protein (TIGR03435 family)